MSSPGLAPPDRRKDRSAQQAYRGSPAPDHSFQANRKDAHHSGYSPSLSFVMCWRAAAPWLGANFATPVTPRKRLIFDRYRPAAPPGYEQCRSARDCRPNRSRLMFQSLTAVGRLAAVFSHSPACCFPLARERDQRALWTDMPPDAAHRPALLILIGILLSLEYPPAPRDRTMSRSAHRPAQSEVHRANVLPRPPLSPVR